MNDIDRGVESMDFAIRRRFTWIQVKPEDRLSMLADKLSNDVRTEAEKRMLSLNAAIAEEEVLGPAYQIGPAYFLKLADYKSSAFENLWSWHIEPLIEEYLRGIPDAKQIKQKLYKKYQLTDEVPSEN
jgi:5-methylcytosine-specific restriction endonuclease McrBC GTP-binding regulatory subunit McrB